MNYVFRIDFKKNHRNQSVKVLSDNKQKALNEFFDSNPDVDDCDIVNHTVEETHHKVLNHILQEFELKPNEANLISSLSAVALMEVYHYVHNHHTAHIETVARRVYDHVLEKYLR